MKNKSLSYMAVLVLVASALAFVYLNSCGLPLELTEANDIGLEPKYTEPTSSNMADIKLIQFVLDKLIFIFSSR